MDRGAPHPARDRPTPTHTCMLSRPRWAPRPWRSMEEALIWLSSMRCDSIPMGGHSGDAAPQVVGSTRPTSKPSPLEPRAHSPHTRDAARAALPACAPFLGPRLPHQKNGLMMPHPRGPRAQMKSQGEPPQGPAVPGVAHICPMP